MGTTSMTRWMLSVLAGVAAIIVLGAAPGFAADDVGVVDPETGIWYLHDASSDTTTSFYFGNPADEPFVGDWDCDGVDTVGLYRRADGFVYLRNANSQGVADLQFFFGNPGDIPLAGDFDGDGCDTVSLYRPSQGKVYVVNTLGRDGEGLGRADMAYALGHAGDVPIVGDFDGDGRDTVHMHRPSSNRLYINDGLTPTGSGSVAVAADARVVAGSWFGGVDAAATFSDADAAFAVPGRAGMPYGSPSMKPVAGAFGTLPGGDDAPPRPPPYPDVGNGKRIIYSNGQQRVWLIDANERLVDTYLVSGRKGIPYNGTYTVFSKSVNAWAPYGGITMKHMVRFVRPGTWGNQWSYGFHSIPRYPGGQPMQTEDQLGTWRSGGCVRQADHKAEALFAWADIGTVVHAIP